MPEMRRLFLPVHLLLTTLLGHAGAEAGRVKFQDDRMVDHLVNGRVGVDASSPTDSIAPNPQRSLNLNVKTRHLVSRRRRMCPLTQEQRQARLRREITSIHNPSRARLAIYQGPALSTRSRVGSAIAALGANYSSHVTDGAWQLLEGSRLDTRLSRRRSLS